MTEITRKEGTLHRLRDNGQWGFIAGDDGLDYFFHRKFLRDTRQETPPIGARMRFVIAPVTDRNAKGRTMRAQAIDVEVL